MKNSKTPIAKRASTLILRAALVAIGLIVLAICIFALPPSWMSVAEEFPGQYTYVGYGLIAALYAATIPFLFALYQAIRILGYIDNNTAFSKHCVKALANIAYCGVAIGVVFTASFPLLFIWGDKDDAPGLIVIGMFLVVAPLIVSVIAAVMQRVLKEAIRLKSENDLTV